MLQQNWLTRLIGFDYEIVYKKGSGNIVADALLRQNESEGSIQALALLHNSYGGLRFNTVGKKMNLYSN